jgi:peptide/nickel transport system substrate-binding protein
MGTGRARLVRLGVALVAGVLLALCVLGPGSARTDAGPRYGGTLVVAGADPSTLDPTLSNFLMFYRATCLQLYEDHGGLQVIPVLATALPVLSKDKLSYTIQLRQGVLFNDGTPFNAQAVVANYQHYIAPASIWASDFANVDSVAATGPYTVVYHLTQRNSTFTGNMFVLSPTQLAKLGDNFGTDPVCVGPFMFDHRVVGDNITVIKSPYYYDRGSIFLDKIVFKVLPNPAAAVAALQAGDIQVVGNLDPTQLGAVQQNPNLRVLRTSTLGWTGIVINIGNENGVGQPYSNVGTPLARSATLRQAFEEAIDRNTLNRVVFDGLFQPSCTPIPPSNTTWYAATQVACTPYNPKDARKLVAASGFANPTVHILTGTDDTALRFAQFIQGEEASVGINVVIDTADAPTQAARRASGNFDTTGPYGRSPGVLDPDGMISPFLASSGSMNWGGYSNPRLDLILANGLKATSIQARKTLYHVAQQVIQNDRPVIILDNRAAIAAFSANITGVQVTPGGAVTITTARFK